ncbi:MAG: MbnP family protein [Bacteroidota bacterium]|nr:MbnP family protein [Bacteroidota bacterium]
MNRKNILLSQALCHISKMLFVMLVFLFVSCDKNSSEEDDTSGRIVFSFSQKIDGKEIDYDTLKYVNAAGNPYMVNEIQYFISDVRLYNANGNVLLIDEWEDIHYVDTDIESTRQWEMPDEIPAGVYDSISFVFGICEEKNESFMFVNPPNRDMFWPEFLGGGYHYMKLNGKWLPEEGAQTIPFDFHMGIGQIYSGDTANVHDIVGFVQNYFTVSLSNSGFEISEKETKNFDVVMNVEQWFENPEVYDHNIWHGYIMQNQNAMAVARRNGHNVFEIKK